jgi:predicted RNase H-like HicB family nuclease
VILKVHDHYVGYVKGNESICSMGDTVEEVLENIIIHLEIMEYVQMEVAVARLLKELNIETDENDESTID